MRVASPSAHRFVFLLLFYLYESAFLAVLLFSWTFPGAYCLSVLTFGLSCVQKPASLGHRLRFDNTVGVSFGSTQKRRCYLEHSDSDSPHLRLAWGSWSSLGAIPSYHCQSPTCCRCRYWILLWSPPPPLGSARSLVGTFDLESPDAYLLLASSCFSFSFSVDLQFPIASPSYRDILTFEYRSCGTCRRGSSSVLLGCSSNLHRSRMLAPESHAQITNWARVACVDHSQRTQQ